MKFCFVIDANLIKPAQMIPLDVMEKGHLKYTNHLLPPCDVLKTGFGN